MVGNSFSYISSLQFLYCTNFLYKKNKYHIIFYINSHFLSEYKCLSVRPSLKYNIYLYECMDFNVLPKLCFINASDCDNDLLQFFYLISLKFIF